MGKLPQQQYDQYVHVGGPLFSNKNICILWFSDADQMHIGIPRLWHDWVKPALNW